MFIMYNPEFKVFSLYENDTDIIMEEHKYISEGRRPNGLHVYELFFNDIDSYNILKEIKKRDEEEGLYILDKLVLEGSASYYKIVGVKYLIEEDNEVGYEVFSTISQAKIYARERNMRDVPIYCYVVIMCKGFDGLFYVVDLDEQYDIIWDDFNTIEVDRVK